MRVLGFGLLVVLVLAWLSFGGVHHGSRAVLHLGLAGLALLAAALPPSVLRKTGVALPFAAAAALMLAACAVGLVPLPRAVLGMVSPGVVVARPGFAFWTLSLDPERTLSELADLALPLGTGVLVAVWAAAQPRRRGPRTVILGAVGLVALVGVAHAAGSQTALFGRFQSSLGEHQVFWAPFIDPNHFGTALVLGLPLVVWGALDPDQQRSNRWASAVAAVAIVAVLVMVQSAGAIVSAAVVLLAVALNRGLLRSSLGLGLGLVGVAGVAVAVASVETPGASMGGRLSMWLNALRVWLGSWLAGSGGGTFGLAVQPEHLEFDHWTHAHNDWVEWLTETGLVGCVALGVALWWVRPGRQRRSGWGTPLSIGVFGVLVHAMVDFPLQIPALAMATAAVWAVRRGVCEERVAVSPHLVRAVLIAVVVAQGAAALWELRSRTVEGSIATLRTVRTDVAAQQTLERWAPWRAEVALAQGWRALDAGERATAADEAGWVVDWHPHDAGALRRAGSLLAAAGEADVALEVLERSRLRYPGDWRTAVQQARLLEGDDASDAWLEAFRVGAPPAVFDEAWPTLPIGLVWLEVAEDREPRFIQALGTFLLQQSEPDTALIAFDLAHSRDPSLRASTGHVRLLIGVGRLEHARALVDSPGRVRDDVLMAEILEASGEHEEAAAMWKAIAPRSPSHTSKAIRTTERLVGADPAFDLAETLRERKLLDDRGVLELARLHRARDELVLCRARIERAGLLEPGPLQGRAQRLHGQCQRVRP